MKKMRKGFTLVELLIVIAILGAMSAMMATSSSESIDASAASAILNNLQTMKTAAFEMYMERADIASLSEVANDTDIDGDDGEGEETVGDVLGKLLGRIDIADNYGIIGDGSSWYVYYTITADESKNVKDKLAAAANKSGLLGGTAATVAVFGAATDYYGGTDDEEVIALKVR